MIEVDRKEFREFHFKKTGERLTDTEIDKILEGLTSKVPEDDIVKMKKEFNNQ